MAADAVPAGQELRRGGAIEVRTITKPVAGTVEVYRDGVVATSGVREHHDRVVTFTPRRRSDVIVTADFEFDVPVRFDTDQMEVTIETYNLEPGRRSRSSSSGPELRVQERMSLEQPRGDLVAPAPGPSMDGLPANCHQPS